MAAKRFIRILAMAAIASGVLAVGSVARAQGGGADRALMFFGRSQQAPDQLRQNDADQLVRTEEPSAPLPPRRPKILEAAVGISSPPPSVPEIAPASSFPSAQTVSVPELQDAPSGAEKQADTSQESHAGREPAMPSLPGAMSPPDAQTMRNAGIAALPVKITGNGEFPLSLQPVVAMPILDGGQLKASAETTAERKQSAVADTALTTDVFSDRTTVVLLPSAQMSFAPDNRRNEGNPFGAATGGAFSVAALSQPDVLPQRQAPVAALPPEILPVQPDAAPVLVKAPLPPQRPDNLSENARVELTSLQQESAVQDEGKAKAPGFFERLFTAPPGHVGDAVLNERPRPRALSKLNRVIGDDPRRATQLRSLISKHAEANGIPFKFADAVVRIESRYNPRARNGPYIGLTQIHPRTARSLGYGGDAAGLFDPDTNLRYGIKYLAMAYRLAGGDTCGTVMRYQGGHRAVSMTSANRTYCSKVKMIFAENLH